MLALSNGCASGAGKWPETLLFPRMSGPVAALARSRGRNADSLDLPDFDGRSITPTAASAAVSAAFTAAAITAPVGLGNPWLGFVDGKPPSFVFLFVQCLDRRLGLVVRIHFNKTEALASAGVTVRDHLGVCTVPNSPNHDSRSVRVTE